MKKFCSIFLSLILLLSLRTTSFATNSENCDQILCAHEISDETISMMDTEVNNSLNSSPEKVQIVSGSIKISIVKEILAFINTPDEEFINAGVSPSALASARMEIDEILDLDDNDASEALGVTLEEVQILRTAISTGCSYDELPLPYEISEADLTLEIRCKDNSSATQDIKYDITVSFTWQKPFLIDLFSDRIAVSWGGELFESNISAGEVNYYRFSKPNTWNQFFGKKTMTLSDEESNHHFLMSFPQQYNGLGQPRSGSFSFTLTRNNAQGEDTYLIVRYGHQILVVSGVGVSWGSGSAEFNSSYDQTPISAGRIKLRY